MNLYLLTFKDKAYLDNKVYTGDVVDLQHVVRAVDSESARMEVVDTRGNDIWYDDQYTDCVLLTAEGNQIVVCTESLGRTNPSNFRK
jgi:hypothetical protein